MIDFRQFFHFSRLTFVKKVHEHDDVWTFYFTPSHTLDHTAGQHGLVILPWLRGLHFFSLASAPEEQYVMIGTHVRKESRYKQMMARLRPGKSLYLFGPALNFFLPKQDRPILFLAQGIGITPFRSMLVHNKQSGRDLPITLVHVDGHPHTYQEQTKQLATTALYPTNPEEFTQAITKLARKATPSTLFYLSGSPRFTKTTRQTLRRLGVSWRNIKKDSFLGY